MQPLPRRPILLWSIAALAVYLTGSACTPENSPAGAQPSPAEPPPVIVLVTTASQRSVVSEVSTVGSLRSPETTQVAADVAGIIVALNAPEGRRIARGHVVAQLDDAETQASLQVAEARERNARTALERVRPLVADGVVPEQNLDDAEAELATALGLLEEAKTRLRRTTIRAPFGGLVGIQTAQVGQFVSSGDSIIELTQLDPLELVFGVPEEQASFVRVGQKVQARVGRCGLVFEGTVEAIDPQIDQQARTLAVQARVDNAERQLIPGMSARVRLPIGSERQAVVVPREAVVARGSGYVAWVAADDGRVESRPLRLGRFYPDVVEVMDGLNDGETVVAAGHQKLGPGVRINPQPWEGTENHNLDRGTDSDDDCLAETSP
ncbi:MAG: efflux RND transporter periplasmic adaptor subunit [Acidobacteriota bacterium]